MGLLKPSSLGSKILRHPWFSLLHFLKPSVT